MALYGAHHDKDNNSWNNHSMQKRPPAPPRLVLSLLRKDAIGKIGMMHQPGPEAMQREPELARELQQLGNPGD